MYKKLVNLSITKNRSQHLHHIHQCIAKFPVRFNKNVAYLKTEYSDLVYSLDLTDAYLHMCTYTETSNQ